MNDPIHNLDPHPRVPDWRIAFADMLDTWTQRAVEAGITSGPRATPWRDPRWIESYRRRDTVEHLLAARPQEPCTHSPVL